MLPYQYILSVAILTSAPDCPEQTAKSKSYARMRAALQVVAVQMEILDPREMRYILANEEDFASDLNLLRRRALELADAPALHDSMRFPDRDTVNEMLTFNREFRRYVDFRQTVDRSRWWDHQLTLQETEQLYQIWDTVRDSRCDYYYVSVRRQALKRLRELLGEQAYYSGELPPYVPIWRFDVVNN